MRVGTLFLLALVSIAACMPGTAMARDRSHRLLMLQLNTEGSTITSRGDRSLLTLVTPGLDDKETRRTTQLTVPFDAADGLSFEVTRLSVRLPALRDLRKDSFRLRQVRVGARIPVTPEIDLLMIGDGAYMKRNIAIVPSDSGRGRVLAARAGLGIASGNWTLSAQYETVGTKARRRPMHRMAEVLGGAPLNREGLAVVASTRQDLTERRSLDVFLTGRMGRPTRADMDITGVSAARGQSVTADIGVNWTF